jgi:hypothetical protein
MRHFENENANLTLVVTRSFFQHRIIPYFFQKNSLFLFQLSLFSAWFGCAVSNIDEPVDLRIPRIVFWSNQAIKQSSDQSITQSLNQSINQSLNQSINQSNELTNRSIAFRAYRSVAARNWAKFLALEIQSAPDR